MSDKTGLLDDVAGVDLYWPEKFRLVINAFQIFAFFWAWPWHWPHWFLLRTRYFLLFNLDLMARHRDMDPYSFTNAL
eukprot:gene7478-6999_t